MEADKPSESTAVEALVNSKERIFSEQQTKLTQVIEQQEELIRLLGEGNTKADKLLSNDFTSNIEKFDLYTKKLTKLRAEMDRVNIRVANIKQRLSKLEDIRLKEQQDIDDIKKSQQTVFDHIIAKPPE